MSKPQILRVTEIFHSLQGEAKTAGIPTVFVRLTGCPLRCQYCDTAYAFEGGVLREVDDIIKEVEAYNCEYVTVTGGEPLAQPLTLELLSRLCSSGYVVSLETGGAISIANIDERVSIVLDLKTPGSMECDRNCYENVGLLKATDQVKFVICSREDYEWSKAKIAQLDLHSKVDEILFSPSHDQQSSQQLAEWILDDGLKVRLQLQLHKQIWNAEPGR
ncbi:MAG: 7-carboxy-7-deazaguanine synthase QueE [Gammaproteobacteria bacterium]|jgi:7-carboxy-7-deazaguanine synthase|nr:7-carboxy-7-deazaguanine synthase QueE [Gammaproteobacteria bacterium]MDP6095275.1 7-carboxy-7-deazaguanine synthase QueE [Gammaproteobacteria bacterium]|tara:strand:+ start:287 stop:940 length:654 start_codon:yes stop_codon:yes gene_type:complete